MKINMLLVPIFTVFICAPLAPAAAQDYWAPVNYDAAWGAYAGGSAKAKKAVARKHAACVQSARSKNRAGAARNRAVARCDAQRKAALRGRKR